MYCGPCDLDKFRYVTFGLNKVVYGDRLLDVEVYSPNKSGYFDYKLILSKRIGGGLDYKFGQSNCSETLKLK